MLFEIIKSIIIKFFESVFAVFSRPINRPISTRLGPEQPSAYVLNLKGLMLNEDTG